MLRNMKNVFVYNIVNMIGYLSGSFIYPKFPFQRNITTNNRATEPTKNREKLTQLKPANQEKKIDQQYQNTHQYFHQIICFTYYILIHIIFSPHSNTHNISTNTQCTSYSPIHVYTKKYTPTHTTNPYTQAQALHNQHRPKCELIKRNGILMTFL